VHDEAHVCHRVLVVDDDPRIRRAYQAYLSSAGYEVTATGSLREARACLARHGWDVVIVDLCLGPDGADGLELAEQVARRRGRPVLVVTAYGEPIFGRAAARLGADLFLHKPVSLDWLEEVVRDALAERRLATAHAS
jgi:DNA-binding NtrC family response regulator